MELENIDGNKQKNADSKNNQKKAKRKDRRKKRENILLSDYLSMKSRIILSIIEVGKKEYFTYDDIFASVVTKLGVDLNNVKKLKSLYNYINRIMLQLEEDGYVKGFNVPGQRRVVWKLVRPPIQS